MIKVDLGKYICKAVEAVLKEQGYIENSEVRLVTKTGGNLLPSYQKGCGREVNIAVFKERCRSFNSYFLIFPTKLDNVYVVCSVPSKVIYNTNGRLSLKECKSICSSIDKEIALWLH